VGLAAGLHAATAIVTAARAMNNDRTHRPPTGDAFTARATARARGVATMTAGRLAGIVVA
jgi:hypothetical protein